MALGFGPLSSLVGADIRQVRDRAQRKALFLGGIGVFALLALVFALAAMTVALSLWIGLLGAVLSMLLACILVVLVLILVMRAADRRDREIAAAAAARRRRLYQVAALAGLPRGIRARPARIGLGLGLVALGGLLIVMRIRPRDRDE